MKEEKEKKLDEAAELIEQVHTHTHNKAIDKLCILNAATVPVGSYSY